MTINGETLMAYLDNELTPEERARVEAALASDPHVRAQLARQTRLHDMLSAAFDPAIRQPLPDRLAAAVMTTPVSLRWRLRDTISRLFSVRDDGSRFVPRYAPITAALLLGIAVGLASMNFLGGSGALREGRPLLAEGELANALSRQLASDTTRAGPHVGVSFRAKDGKLCRTFDLGAPAKNFAGIACNDAGAWIIETLTRAQSRPGTPYQVAGSEMPPVVRNAVADLIAGEPFDVEQERRARDGGWR